MIMKEADIYGTIWIHPGVRQGSEPGKTTTGNAGIADQERKHLCRQNVGKKLRVPPVSATVEAA